MHAHLSQALNVGNGTQILRVHDVSAVFVFKRGHVLTRTLGFFDHKDFVSRRANTQRWLNILYRDRLVLMHDIAHHVFFAFLHVVFPAAGIGTGTLIWVTLVDVAREQAAAGVSHAQRAVNKDLNFHIRHLGADLFNFFQRQFAGQDHTGQSHLLPEFHRRPVYGVSLY